MLLKVFHLVAFSVCSFAMYYDQMYVELPYPSKEIEAMPLKARHLFLTMWCLVFQILYYAVSFLNDVFGTNSPAPKNPPVIRRMKDNMFAVAFALAIYVPMAFWSIYVFNKDLILPEEISEKLPVWLNHIIHTSIAPFILIEMFSTNKKYPTRKFGLTFLMTLIGVYSVWLHTVYFMTGVWAYPFMAYFGVPMRIVFYVISTIIGVSIYDLGEKINSLVSTKNKVYTNGVNGVKKH